MGVLSDLVLAAESDAEKILHTSVPSRALGGIDIKGIDSVKFGMLHSILTGQPFEELLPQYDPVASVSDEDGPWVFRLPADLVSGLARLQPSEIRDVAHRWAQIEEFALDGWTDNDVAKALDAILVLAKKAVQSKQTLFLWICL